MPVRVIDSHTEGEPTRVVIDGAPALGDGDVAARARVFSASRGDFRRGVVCEPRGHEAMVGALLLGPVDPSCVAAVVFFNVADVLGMCVHGTIGVVRTLAHLGRIDAGTHAIETPVGVVRATLRVDGAVEVENVPSFRARADHAIDVPGLGRVVGDVAWGGNWFFLVDRASHGIDLARTPLREINRAAIAVQDALDADDWRPDDGRRIDHVEFFDAPTRADCRSRNYVLCPSGTHDRSPCGTGTSAKLACLAARDALAEGEEWGQESIVGSAFVGRYRRLDEERIAPIIRGRAWITGEATLRFDADDPFRVGLD